MAHPLVWPGKYFFYPIGNTPAVCLTKDLASEEPANVLLLGCGDPRSILSTVSVESDECRPRLDFTCCDVDPAILARNVLLLTLIADKAASTVVIWNIFFHMYLDERSHKMLVEQCRKLIDSSQTLQLWAKSPYAQFIRMGTEYTLFEIRRHWSLYADMRSLPSSRIKSIRAAFTEASKPTPRRAKFNFSSARSAGPLMFRAIEVSSTQFHNYWRTGTTFTDRTLTAAAHLLNPTFVYSLAGEGCNVHYGTDPMECFHLAALFGNNEKSVTISDIVKAAQAEFSDWCSTFAAAISSIGGGSPVVRFLLGEATAVCQALRGFVVSGTLNSSIPVAQWNTRFIQLNAEEYVTGTAPTEFNVVDTSNLDDHIGLLNVLLSSVPLLEPPPRPSVLYTESLLVRGDDATKEFAERLYANIAVIGLLLGICPVDYLAGFTSRSNTHELMTYMLSQREATQFQQVTSWKSPICGDAYAVHIDGGCPPPTFDTSQLGTFLYDMYHDLFEQEDAMHFLRLNQGNMRKAIATSNLIHYTRESFVLFLKLVRIRLRIQHEQWLEVMDRFFNIMEEDQTLKMDSCNQQDFYSQLHRHGVHTLPFLLESPPKVGRFADWPTVPALVRIILIVPREKLSVLNEVAETIGTPLLQCDIRGRWIHNIFSSVHVAYGRAIMMGPRAHPWVTFEQDPDGTDGNSTLVVSFTMATRYLTEFEPPSQIRVSLSVRNTTASVILVPKLGINLILFAADLMDESAVFVVPEQPFPGPGAIKDTPSAISPGFPAPHTQIGASKEVVADLDEQCELVSALTSRITVQTAAAQQSFKSGAMPQIVQVSPCTMRITLGDCVQDVIYPFPVIGSQNKLRLARKSLYIDVVVPPYGPFKPDGTKINPFPAVDVNKNFHLWSMHYVNLSRLPAVDLTNRKLDEWLNPHVGSMMSKRERSLRKKHKDDTLMYVKDSLLTIMVRSSGIQHGPAKRVYALRDDATNNCDTIIFISELKFDLHCHTVICDGYALPLTPDLLRKTEIEFAKLVTGGDISNVSVFSGEMQAWKQLLPVAVERCRRSWTHGDDCQYRLQGKIPLSVEMEVVPLCKCGMGKDTEVMEKVTMWKPFARYATRIALSPLFAVSYLETVGRDPWAHKCYVCRGKGKPNIRACSGCKKVRYCSQECQKKHWKVHKLKCKP